MLLKIESTNIYSTDQKVKLAFTSNSINFNVCSVARFSFEDMLHRGELYAINAVHDGPVWKHDLV